jgi:hypothetical protein
VWAEGEVQARGGSIEKPVVMILDEEAQGRFFGWRNELQAFNAELPAQFQGFLAKAYEYCLRLTGTIHCMWRFAQGESPARILELEDLERGIKAITFYLGQVQAVLQLIKEEDYAPVEVSERTILLAQTLEKLRPHVDSGRLAIGFIQEQYNGLAPKTHGIKTGKAMSAFLRSVNLTITVGKHDANDRRSVYCLEWNQKTEELIKQSLQSLHHLKNQDWCGLEGADFKKSKSAKSASNTGAVQVLQTLQTSEKQSLHLQGQAGSGPLHIADIADVISKEKKLEVFEDDGRTISVEDFLRGGM